MNIDLKSKIINYEKQKESYRYTIITPAYNVEEYIIETVESVFHQTWLKRNKHGIQMIVVNDGSTDSTLEILKELSKKYDDLLVIDKENSGVSDTRNIGARFAKGIYWEFLDSDDKLGTHAVELADQAFSEYPDLKLFKMNRKYFERSSGFVEYYMKDLKVSGLINTRIDPYHPIIHIASTFFHNSLWEENMFPKEVIYGEDAWVASIMIEKSPIVYYSFEANYWYRRRMFENSLVDLHKGDPRKYTGQLENYYMPFLRLIKKRFGSISKHVQSTILYSISWNLKNKETFSFFTEEYLNDYISKISVMLEEFDDEVIVKQQRLMNYYLRHSLLILKHTGKLPQDNQFYPITVDKNLEVPVIVDYLGRKIERFDDRKARIVVLKSIDNSLSILGSINSIFNFKIGANFSLFFKNSRGEKFYFNHEFPVPLKSYYFMDIELKRHVGFSANIPSSFFENSNFLELCGELNVDDKCYSTVFEMDFVGHFSWIVNHLPGSYFYHNDKIVFYSKEEKRLVIEEATKDKIKFQNKVFRKNLRKKIGLKKAFPILVWREVASKITDFKNSRRMIINMYMDRDSSAWDNGTAVILKHNQILKEQNNRNEKNYFVLQKNSSSFRELKTMGVKVIPFNSIRHKLLVLAADRLISSQANLSNINPFRSKWGNKLNDKQTYEFYYLQHGVSLRKTASIYNPWMTRTKLGIDHIVAGNYLEYDYLTNPKNGNEFIAENVKWVGQGRHDYLHVKSFSYNSKERKKILVMPTWRTKLTIWKRGQYAYNPMFKLSNHFSVWNSFLNSEDLKRALDNKNVELIFAPHPLEQIQLEDFDLKYVDHVLKEVTNYNKLINECDAFVTDFSSLGMDFFYENKPIFIIDTDDDNWENFDDKVSYQNGNFGAVSKSVDEIIEKIIISINEDFEVTQELKNFREDFYSRELDNESISEKILKEFKIIN